MRHPVRYCDLNALNKHPQAGTAGPWGGRHYIGQQYRESEVHDEMILDFRKTTDEQRQPTRTQEGFVIKMC